MRLPWADGKGGFSSAPQAPTQDQEMEWLRRRVHELEDAHNDLMHVLAEEFGFALTSRLHSNSYLLDFQRAPVKQAEHLMTTRGSLTPKGE